MPSLDDFADFCDNFSLPHFFIVFNGGNEEEYSATIETNIDDSDDIVTTVQAFRQWFEGNTNVTLREVLDILEEEDEEEE
tara:strand:+ start:4836 stop:5075 length:240 start_codon:yes stop_codon:yes gene_type:complete